MTSIQEIQRDPLPEEERIVVRDYLDEVRRVALEKGFHAESSVVVGEFSVPVLTRQVSQNDWLYVSSGVHGDEPAGPLAILEALKGDGFSTNENWMVFPMLNPAGCLAGSRTTAEGIDLNRDYRSLQTMESRSHCQYLESKCLRFRAALGLHEDWEATGGYLYEHNRKNLFCPRAAILEAIEEHVGLEPGEEIDGWPTTELALIHPPSLPETRDMWPEQIFLLKNFTLMSYTVETPSEMCLADRIAAHVKTIEVFGDPDRWSKV